MRGRTVACRNVINLGLHATILLGVQRAVVLPAHQVPLALVVRVAVPLTLFAQVVGAPVPIHGAAHPAAVHVGADIGAKVFVAVVPAAHRGPLALGVSVAVPLPYNARFVLGAEAPGEFQCSTGIAYCRGKQKYRKC